MDDTDANTSFLELFKVFDVANIVIFIVVADLDMYVA